MASSDLDGDQWHLHFQRRNAAMLSEKPVAAFRWQPVLIVQFSASRVRNRRCARQASDVPALGRTTFFHEACAWNGFGAIAKTGSDAAKEVIGRYLGFQVAPRYALFSAERLSEHGGELRMFREIDAAISGRVDEAVVGSDDQLCVAACEIGE